MPKGIKGSGAAAAKGIALARAARVVGTEATGLENDPEIARALQADREATAALDTELDVQETMEEALEDLEGDLQVKRHPIGNGTTVPFPYEEDTTDESTCSRHVPGTNRGCMFWGRCPMGRGKPLAEKFKFSGPANLVYKNLRTGRVKTAFCTTFAASYLRSPFIVLLPGPDWFPTRSAEYKPLPNGQQPMPGPNQPRTPIVLTPHKTQLVCVPPEGLVKEYQQMRRRGDFEPKPKRARR